MSVLHAEVSAALSRWPEPVHRSDSSGLDHPAGNRRSGGNVAV